MIKNVGSICSGIEAASVSWIPLGLKFEWFSEIADFPSRILEKQYPNIKNLGDMNNIPNLIKDKKIVSPDVICGGTPCQAFSLAGLKQGLNDERGNLALKFVDIIEENDKIRLENKENRTIVFWENVPGVLTDKTNAFGCLVSYLAGLDEPIELKKWPTFGVIHGKKRNVAWRVLDSKYFGVPQQRKRLYLLAGDTSFYPENVLFEQSFAKESKFPSFPLTFTKEGHTFEVFRAYTDCLYSAYGTKWNGNAAAYNGSLFIVQDSRIRRLCPIETERLMGFPDNYTYLKNSKNTNRFKATGNSWVVPVISWIGKRIIEHCEDKNSLIDESFEFITRETKKSSSSFYIFGTNNSKDLSINVSDCPQNCVFANIKDFVCVNDDESLYISPVGCYGIIRRKKERNLGINKRLEQVLTDASNKMTKEQIDKRSRVQKRGKLSN